ncbi:hypothetical protein N1851_003517 [Merluccius polli]|uniref:Endonuclease/exonuclease/phosphatase domain-containing protein n=1 Tax=Merluccius polli TaxID=89951 RepID=A0AA47N8J6_MERPO|nr:hypothetical protein N1851_003517 [Merluccius polli]
MSHHKSEFPCSRQGAGISPRIGKQQTSHPEAAFIVAGDFNHSNLKTVLPKFHQYVSCTTRGDKYLDHVYSNMTNAYKAIPLPHLGQSDHLSWFSLPKYTPLIKRVKPTVRTVKVWPEGADSALQYHFESTDWSVFATQATLDSHTDIDSYASSVLDFINSNINSVTTLKQITRFPNQKPWRNREVCLLLKARDTAFRSDDTPTVAYNIDSYASSILDYINTCVDNIITHKLIRTFPNQKPWMNREVRLLLRESDVVYRSGDATASSSSRAKLKRCIREAKHNYKLQI